MLQALKTILFSVAGILLCWLPLVFAAYDAMRGARVGFLECVRREWARWWDVNEDLRV